MSTVQSILTKTQLLRQQTPGCCTGKIHFNNAGCSLPPKPVVDKLQKWIEQEAVLGGYETARLNHAQLEDTKQAMADLLNCSASEIGIVNSATRAWQQVFFGTWPFPIQRVFTTMTEYGSNYINFLQLQKKNGLEIKVIPENELGEFELEWLEDILKHTEGRGDLVAISHMPTSSGKIVDAEGIGEVVSRFEHTMYLLDACQTVGQIPLDVQRIGCHFLTGTGRKYLRGPRGSGFVYACQGLLDVEFEPASLDMRSANWTTQSTYILDRTAKRFEEFEMSTAAAAGLGVAVRYALQQEMQWIGDQIIDLAQHLRQQLASLEGVVVCDQGQKLGGIVSFVVRGYSASEIMQNLSEVGTSVSVSSICSSRLVFESRGLEEVVRASVHYYNTKEEVDLFVKQVNKIIQHQQS